MTRTLALLLTLAAAGCAAALLVLAWHPEIDLRVAGLFYAGNHHFSADTPLGTLARYIAWYAPFALLAAFVLTYLAARAGLWPPRLALSGRHLLFVVLSFALSPGLFVYGTFKPLAHRPRPHSVAAFGGPDAFRPFVRFDGACHHSCSFPSGETAGALWSVAPASLAPLPWRGAAVAAALAFGAATGLLRIAFGGHFLSDVLGAALFTLVSVLVASWLLRDRTV